MVELDEGRPAELVARARQLAAEQPYRERRWALLMLILYRAGRQAEALDAYAECRRRLIDDLGLDPGSALRRMQQAVLGQDPILDSAAATSALAAGTAIPAAPVAVEPAALPARIPGTSTRLIGRVSEQRDLAEVWARARLVTLLGPPGAGKTRLALELARNAPAPVLVRLARADPDIAVRRRGPARRRGPVVARSRRARGCRERPRLRRRPDRPRRRRGPPARSGRRPRDPARGLPPDPDPDDQPGAPRRPRRGDRAGRTAAADEALDLLVDRARLQDPRFRLGPDDLALADHLCTLVDRLPLGLELVARHLQLLRLDEVVKRVESDTGRWAGGPIGGRAGLWAALDASVERLRPAELQALVALAVMVPTPTLP